MQSAVVKLIGLVAILLAPCGARAIVSVEVQQTMVDPGALARVEVYLRSGSDHVAAIENDIVFDARAVRLPSDSSCRINPRIGVGRDGCEGDDVFDPCKSFYIHFAACGGALPAPGCEGESSSVVRLRANLATHGRSRIDDFPPDVLLYTCEFEVLDPARLPVMLRSERVIASDASGERLPAQGIDGSISPSWPPPDTPAISAPTATSTPSATPTATRTLRATPTRPVSSLRLRPRAAERDDELLVDVILDTGGLAVAGLQSDIRFDGDVLQLNPGDCTINPDISSTHPDCESEPPQAPCKTLYRQLAECGADPTPDGCAGQPSNIERLRAIIVAAPAGNPITIPDGVVLYSCKFRFAGEQRSAILDHDFAVSSTTRGTRLAIEALDGLVGPDAPAFATRTAEAVAEPTATATQTPRSALEGSLGGPIEVALGEELELPPGTAYVAVGDLDHDDIADAAVSSVDSGMITLAASDGAGGFRSRLDLQVGHRIGDLVILPTGSDATVDIISSDTSTDRPEPGLFALRFDPASGDVVRRALNGTIRSERLVVADFDHSNGPDLGSADHFNDLAQRVPDFSIILNRGDDRGFAAPYRYDIGRAVDSIDIGAGDFDGDGNIDVVVLDGAPASGQTLVALKNDGIGQFLSHVDIPNGRWVVALTVGDFNGDGLADIALLSGDTPQYRYFVTLLLSRSTVVDDSITTTFDPTVIEGYCNPSGTLGVLTLCQPRDIGVADFNQDGVLDLVLSLTTWADIDAALVMPGRLVYFEGLGGARLTPSTMIEVGPNAGNIAVGDVTGDRVADVVVARDEGGVVIARTISKVLPPAEPTEEVEVCCSGDDETPTPTAAAVTTAIGEARDLHSAGGGCAVASSQAYGDWLLLPLALYVAARRRRKHSADALA